MNKTWKFDDFKILKKIGSGSFSTVKLAVEKTSAKQYALKIVKNNKITDDYSKNRLFTEVAIQTQLKHLNILTCFGYFVERGLIIILLQYCQRGSMFHDIRKCHGYNETRIATYAFQISSALKYLSQFEIIHRDIKSENILLLNEGAVQITDFGWVTFFNEKRQTFCGTIQYLAPEIKLGQNQTEKVDIWSFGILLFEMVHLDVPLLNEKLEIDSLNHRVLSCDNKDGVVKDVCSLLLRSLINNLLRIDAYERLSPSQILRHPFIQTHSEMSLHECKAAIKQWNDMDISVDKENAGDNSSMSWFSEPSNYDVLRDDLDNVVDTYDTSQSTFLVDSHFNINNITNSFS